LRARTKFSKLRGYADKIPDFGDGAHYAGYRVKATRLQSSKHELLPAV
jgi:hypothetical protein